MDYHMPRLSGKDAIIQVRQLEREHGVPPVPVVAYTADVCDMAKATLLNAGATVVLSKPTPAGLMEQVVSDMITGVLTKWS
jgi:two-component system, NarL family, sensor histidine kinase BarA